MHDTLFLGLFLLGLRCKIAGLVDSLGVLFDSADFCKFVV